MRCRTSAARTAKCRRLCAHHACPQRMRQRFVPSSLSLSLSSMPLQPTTHAHPCTHSQPRVPQGLDALFQMHASPFSVPCTAHPSP